MVVEFFSTLREIQLNAERDKWVWRHTADDSFTMTSTYQTLYVYSLIPVDSVENMFPYLPVIWKSLVASKVVVFLETYM